MAAVPSLSKLCLDVLAVHLDYVEDLGPCVTPDQYAKLVGNPRCRAAPDTVRRLEHAQPDLATAASDEAYWRRRPECVAAAARGAGPLAFVCERAGRHAATLSTSHQPPPARPPPRDHRQAPSYSSKLTAVDAALRDLARLPISVEVLAATGAGVTLAAFLRRVPRGPTRRAAAELLATWKARARRAEEGPLMDGARAADGDFLAERLGACHSWKEVHAVLLAVDERKRSRFRRTAKRLYSEAEASKRFTKALPMPPPQHRKRRRSPSPVRDLSRSLNVVHVSRPPPIRKRVFREPDND